MKIATWNINGLRSSIRHGFETWLSDGNNDVVCLQEVKTPEDLLTKRWFNNYEGHWFTSHKAGYSGVVTLVRSGIDVVSVRRGIGHRESDAEARVLIIELDQFWLVNAYVPHSHRNLTRLAFKMCFCKRLSRYLQNIRLSKPVIVAGDFNVAHTQDDLANPAANRRNAGYLPEEREWFNDLIEDGFVDAFRWFCKESGHYTWWSPIKGVRERNIGWRLDYILVDERMVPSLQACFHSPEERGSDHCPVTAVFCL